MKEMDFTGRTILHYKILHSLGKGGMGEVYAAEDTRLKRKVALKILPAEMSKDETRLNRFQREAEAIAALNHPNVVTIYSVEEAEGIHFLTMELVEGQTLQQLISQVSDADSLLRIAIPVAEALDAAHKKRILHRDLKPGNIMLNQDGRVKVLDFGLAKWMNPEQDEVSTQFETEAQTQDGLILGTVPYMSPEQATGKSLDARSDIFSFGVVLYQLLSGRLPFNGTSAIQILSQILQSDAPPLNSTRPFLERIIRRCLEKDPSRRYPTMGELLADLTALKSGESKPYEEGAPHHLPVAVTKFIGREQELAELSRLLGTTRLITITGAGGSGKSRLALETAIRSTAKFPDGVRYLDLAAATSDLVLNHVANAMEVREQPDRSLLESIVEHLKQRDLLLVFDNCEHVLDESARVLNSILRGTSKLKILATTREAMNLPGETIWVVPSLSLPPSRGTITVESAERCDAVKLFVDRAVARDSRFALNPTNVDAVSRICQRLDGIPLAIELAAARVKLMSASEIQKRLDDCFRFLSAGTRSTPSRHQTLRAAVDWSHDLLTTEEQLLFRRLAVFKGGFDLEAVEKICGGDPLDPDQILDHLSRLIDKSLLLSERSGADLVRYRTLEPLRQYAMEKLAEAGEVDAIARNHLNHYVALAERAYQERLKKETDGLDQLERDHDNLRAALTWSSQHDTFNALKLAGALGWFWVLHSHFSEGRRWLHQVLDAKRDHNRETARALSAEGSLAVLQGDSGALEPFQEGLAIWREIGDQLEIATALDSMGWILWMNEKNQAAMDAFEEALRIQKNLGNERLANRVKLGICQVLVSQLDVELVEPMASECLPVAVRYDDARDIHFAHHFLADCALIRGDVASARVKYSESLRAAVRLGDRFEIAFEIEGIAMALAGLGQDEKAMQLSGAVQAERESLHTSATVAFWMQLQQRYLNATEERMGVDAAEKEKRAGRSMSLEAAIEYALKDESV